MRGEGREIEREREGDQERERERERGERREKRGEREEERGERREERGERRERYRAIERERGKDREIEREIESTCARTHRCGNDARGVRWGGGIPVFLSFCLCVISHFSPRDISCSLSLYLSLDVSLSALSALCVLV